MAVQSNTDWQYVQNQVANALRDSYADTNIFTSDHTSKLVNLAGDPDIDRFINRIDPIYATFQAAYTNWQKSTAYWKGATNKVDMLIDDLLRNKLSRWDILTQVHYEQDSEAYINLFPNGRTAFRDAGKDGKIQLVGTFVSMLDDFPLLAAIKADAEATHLALVAARDRQQQREQNVRDASTRLRKAQEDVFVALYQNLGGLMEKYGKQPEEVLNFFDIPMIRTIGKKKVADEIAKITAIEDNGSDANTEV